MEKKLNKEEEIWDKIKDFVLNVKIDESEKVLGIEMKKMIVIEIRIENSQSGSGEDGDEKFVYFVRIFIEVEIVKFQKDAICVLDFKQNKLEKEVQKNWDLFYKRNIIKFFKDRYWIKREFDEFCLDEVEVDVNIITVFVLF